MRLTPGGSCDLDLLYASFVHELGELLLAELSAVDVRQRELVVFRQRFVEARQRVLRGRRGEQRLL